MQLQANNIAQWNFCPTGLAILMQQQVQPIQQQHYQQQLQQQQFQQQQFQQIQFQQKNLLVQQPVE